MIVVDQRRLRVAAEAYGAAAAELWTAHDEAQAAWTRLETSPYTLEYAIGWNTARRHKAEGAARVATARRACLEVGGCAATELEDQALTVCVSAPLASGTTGLGEAT